VPAPAEPLLRAIGRRAQALGMPAYAVGGCVRDWWLGISTVTDLDVVVEGDGIAAAEAVARELGGAVEIHRQFGTATVRVAGAAGAGAPLRVDFATCRTERYAEPAAYPAVALGTLEQDLRRRDFTMNAMALAIDPVRFGRLIDPFGGREDLRRRRLRALHRRSFIDDPSRILRGLRFAHRFRIGWERQTLRDASAAVDASLITRLNAGRLRKESRLMLREPRPTADLRRLAALLESGARPELVDVLRACLTASRRRRAAQ
jgi:tRNA nucleotidyltransferase (CCA-adding enzyme)